MIVYKTSNHKNTPFADIQINITESVTPIRKVNKLIKQGK